MTSFGIKYSALISYYNNHIKILLKQAWDMQNSKHARELYTITWQVNLMGKDNLEDPGANGRIVMK
jgi:hypothetical protein